MIGIPGHHLRPARVVARVIDREMSSFYAGRIPETHVVQYVYQLGYSPSK